ncbi:hypothetical protein DFH06DRAFT_1125232 [Mycena polygramma]|nr:hypothetical protein DFH06DRAFT_1125232 [Mycena polygramma]
MFHNSVLLPPIQNRLVRVGKWRRNDVPYSVFPSLGDEPGKSAAGIVRRRIIFAWTSATGEEIFDAGSTILIEDRPASEIVHENKPNTFVEGETMKTAASLRQHTKMYAEVQFAPKFRATDVGTIDKHDHISTALGIKLMPSVYGMLKEPPGVPAQDTVAVAGVKATGALPLDCRSACAQHSSSTLGHLEYPSCTKIPKLDRTFVTLDTGEESSLRSSVARAQTWIYDCWTQTNSLAFQAAGEFGRYPLYRRQKQWTMKQEIPLWWPVILTLAGTT